MELGSGWDGRGDGRCQGRLLAFGSVIKMETLYTETQCGNSFLECIGALYT